MKIEKIIKLKNGIYEILIIDDKNGEKKFKLTEDVLIKHNLYSNKVITAHDLALFNELVNYSKIYSSTLNFISFKMRSEKEVIEYLTEKHSSEKQITEMIEKLKKLNYINDQIYSDAYVIYQFDSNKKGVKVIQDELLKKGIELPFINKSLDYIKPEMVINNINQLINYYLKVSKNKTIRKLKENLLRNLIVKGYEYEDIVTCINNFSFEEYHDDESIILKEVNKVYSKYQKKYQSHELRNKVIKALLTKGYEYEDIINNINEINFNE
ncbi:MAG: recX [Haloplasmataceae bacterium]|jgi:regulatory protein|nr:recX [Haloplasmataceae bacterium]